MNLRRIVGMISVMFIMMISLTALAYAEEANESHMTLNSIKVVDSDGASRTFNIEADITHAESEDITVSVEYATQPPQLKEFTDLELPSGMSISCPLEKDTDGKYRGTVTIDNQYIKLYCKEISISDESGNTVIYTQYADILKELYGGGNYIDLTENIDIIPRDYIEDNDSPELVSFKNNKEALQVPDVLTTYFELEDVGSGIDHNCGLAVYNKENGDYYKSSYIDIALDSSGTLTDYYSAEITIGSDEDPGKIYLDRIIISDAVGNLSTYSVDNGMLEKQMITVSANGTGYTLKTGTTEIDYIDKISNLNEGSTVLCDIAANKIIDQELFEKIKGRDITVTFEDIYGEVHDRQGIQWIINGKDVVNPAKDIDMSIEFSSGQYCGMLLKDYEFPEIVWDNTLPYEKAMKAFKADQIEALTDYWNYVKKLGYNNTDEYLDKTIDIVKNSDIDVASAVMEATGYIDYLSINFADNGVLPSETTIRIKPEYALREIIGAENLFLYYIIGDKYDEIDGDVNLSEDGYYEFKIYHNSEYWLTNENINEVSKPVITPDAKGNDDATGNTVTGSKGEDTEQTLNTENVIETGDTMNLHLIIGLMILSVMVMTVLLYTNRKRHSK